ncbi:MAG: helix-turn-helix transcriptional regulator [Myxococcaceae bacterium]|jgi:transcriptional regulator with XRE-family HTH domain|nr:helix-turn-helix transcriptional regulator [Myxococcaceae bacterium]
MMRDGFAGLLKRWRTARRLSQEQLALDAEISTRHLSFLETGKSKPSREMVLVLASALELELKERNVMLTSAGFAPVYTSSALESLELAPVRRAIELLLQQQEPYGAVLVDRCWNVLRMNQGAMRMLGHFVDPATVEPRVATNVVRAVLHPAGMRPFLVNWLEVAQVALERLERECATYPTDEARRALLDEVRQYPGVEAISASTPATGAPVSLVHLRRGDDELRLFTMLTTIGTPLDVTAQELTLESYFPADEATERWIRGG